MHVSLGSAQIAPALQNHTIYHAQPRPCPCHGAMSLLGPRNLLLRNSFAKKAISRQEHPNDIANLSAQLKPAAARQTSELALEFAKK